MLSTLARSAAASSSTIAKTALKNTVLSTSAKACLPRFIHEGIVSSIPNVGTTGDGEVTRAMGRYRESHSHEPYARRMGHEPVICSAEEAVKAIKSNDKVFVHSGSSAPYTLTDALADRGLAERLSNIRLMAMHTEGRAKYASEEYRGIFCPHHFFISGNVRSAINSGLGDYTPIFLSEIPLLFRRNAIELDVALIQVSKMDKHGFVTLGPNVDITRAALNNAKMVIAQENSHMPRTHGSSSVHISNIDYLVQEDTPLVTHEAGRCSPEELAIGKLIAENLVEDGATLQMGIGNVPDAVLQQLGHHKDLGIHTEMFSDRVLPLIESGVITNANKYHHPGKVVTSFVVGSQHLYDYVDDNPLIEFHDASWVNDTSVIRMNPRVTAINSAIEIDLTGQVVSDSIGKRLYSGVGGQVDFIRGASLAEHGRPILAFPARTHKGKSKIVSTLAPNSGVVTSRAHVHYVVTEYGIAQLWGKTLRERARALIDIAHPDDREQLDRECASLFPSGQHATSCPPTTNN